MLKGLFSFNGRYRILHLTWFAFFLTFVCWFNFAPFATTIGKQLNLTPEQVKTLGICNLALTIPARIIIGMLLDRFGPRITYSLLLIFASVPCLATALSQNFDHLVISRLLMGIVGAGFVVGIRMVSEWFPPKEIGIAQGIYGGWGNFGAFGAEFTLPTIAVAASFMNGGASNWRFAIALTGIIAAIYGLIYYNSVQDTPVGKVYKRPKKNGALEVTSVKSFWALIISNFGLIFALGLLAWRLAQKNIHFFTQSQMYLVWLLLAGLFAYQTYKAYQVNKELLIGKKTYAPSERYQFRQVALLEFTYVTNFGSELAVVSMLPAFFEKTFGLEHVVAGMIAATYPFLNLISRPSGGLISDKFGSRKWTMTIISGGIAVGYLMAHFINSSWPIPLAIVVTMFAAYFAQAGCGATYSIAPLIKKEATGQIAGNVGAYGNFGGVVYLTIFSLTDASTLFSTMGIAAMMCAFMCGFFLKEPKDSFAGAYEGELQETTTKRSAIFTEE
ncbi:MULTISPECIES: NarK family nitrate/nitrite MFS transporter [Fischerella]|uniref:Nitrate/nitrite transporter n=1 Tax=Fischerella muscicola CCMEE 5323 TaxID=2019572 RepID=A0A2N6K026_FISMU|nr:MULTISPECIES: NarK family nitrate/nitrite MFS transporter [Fischerella]MBD2431925.1 NarK family nitrate/nitrite MFS transporter [Fischerella sp. FACHB-380]PLZ87264.1 NarK family nitrate/nitrite MFS transporter [Fischerella muscicola CCMEE 5323]